MGFNSGFKGLRKYFLMMSKQGVVVDINWQSVWFAGYITWVEVGLPVLWNGRQSVSIYSVKNLKDASGTRGLGAPH